MSTRMHFPLDPDGGCRFVGRGLGAHRLARDVTRTELAARSGVSPATVERIEATGE